MVWGAFCSSGTLPLPFPSFWMNSDEYIQLLEDHLLTFLQENRQIGYTFQQDNAAVNESGTTTDWLEANNTTVFEWPACSPHMIPIENLWGDASQKENKQY